MKPDNIQIYCKRYKKDFSFGMKSFSGKIRFTDINNEEVSMLHESIGRVKCIYNRNSFRQRMIHEDHSPIIKAEAEIMTYPSKELKRKIFETLKKNLEPWQLECEVEIDGKMVNLLEHFYLESDYSDEDDENKRTAGIVQIGIPVKDPSFKSEEEVSKLKRDLAGKVSWPMRFFGYDFSSVDFHDCEYDVYYGGKMLNWIKIAGIFFEARYQTSLVEPNKYMYHLTTKEKLQRILSKGLAPKSESKLFEYRDRVYLFNCNDLNLMCRYALESNKQTKTWILLQIESSKIQNLKLYIDNMFDASSDKVVFTYNSISPTAIVNYKSIDDQIQKFANSLYKEGQ